MSVCSNQFIGGKSCSYKKKHHKKTQLRKKTNSKKHRKTRRNTRKKRQSGGNVFLKALVPFGLWGAKHTLSKKLRKKR